jgi:hypothetical protein
MFKLGDYENKRKGFVLSREHSVASRYQKEFD